MKNKTMPIIDISSCEDKTLAPVLDLLPTGQFVLSRNNDISALVSVTDRLNSQKQQKLDLLW